jgi:CPA2 family monovalent cation:H+ antiporter-2
MVANPLVAAALVLTFRYPLNTALTIAASLAQIGEFSFILAGLGMTLGLLPQEGQNLILAGALISITLNSLVFRAIEPLQAWIEARIRLQPALARMARREDPLAELPLSTEDKYLAGQVVLVGYGRVGRRIAAALTDASIPFVVVDQNREIVERCREKGLPAVCGDAADMAVLIQAHLSKASLFVIATPDSLDDRRMISVARQVNPEIETVVRTHNEEEAGLLRQEQATVFLGEDELARSMTRYVLERFGRNRTQVSRP